MTTLTVSNKVYDLLKFLVTLLLPALGTLYFTIAQIWGLPNADEVVGTIVAVTTFLGVITRLSSSGYQQNGTDGTMNITPAGDGRKVFELDLNSDPNELADQKVITFKVNHTT